MLNGIQQWIKNSFSRSTNISQTEKWFQNNWCLRSINWLNHNLYRPICTSKHITFHIFSKKENNWMPFERGFEQLWACRAIIFPTLPFLLTRHDFLPGSCWTWAWPVGAQPGSCLCGINKPREGSNSSYRLFDQRGLDIWWTREKKWLESE